MSVAKIAHLLVICWIYIPLKVLPDDKKSENQTILH